MLTAYGAEVVVTPDGRRARQPRVVLLGHRPARTRDPGRVQARPVLEPQRSALPLRDHRPRDLARHRRQGHALRGGRRHGRHDHGQPAGTCARCRATPCASSAPTPRARSTRAAPAARTSSRASARTSGRPPTTPPCRTRSSRSCDAESFAMTRRLAREEGILVGGSSGMAVVAALKAAAPPAPTTSWWSCCPTAAAATSARSSTTSGCARTASRTRPTGHTVADVLAAKADRTAPSSTCTRTTPMREAIDTMTESGVSQLLVLSAEPPVVLGEVVGALHEEELLERVFSGQAKLTDKVSSVVGQPLAADRRERARRRGPRGASRRARAARDRRRQGPRRHHPHRPAHLPLGLSAEPPRKNAPCSSTTHASTPAPSTRDRSSTPPPARSSRPCTSPPPTCRTASADCATATSTRAAATPRAPRWRPSSRRSRAASAASRFASGLAAEDALLRAVLAPGDHVVIGNDVYGGTHRLVRRIFGAWGVRHTTVDTSDLDAVRGAIELGSTKVLWVETPSNPLMKISDIAALAELGNEAGVLVVVDNTFASPALQRPLALGADVVVHSTTKYLGGHSDVVGGGARVRRRAGGGRPSRSTFTQFAAGAVSSPFDAFLTVARHQDPRHPDAAAQRERAGHRAAPRGPRGHRARVLPRPARPPRPRARRPPDVGLRRHDLDLAHGRRRGGAHVRRVDDAVPARRVARRRGVARRTTRRR